MLSTNCADVTGYSHQKQKQKKPPNLNSYTKLEIDHWPKHKNWEHELLEVDMRWSSWSGISKLFLSRL